jgi:hypothetical protein
MAKKNLVIKHDLSKLSAEELTQYLRDVSEFIGLDPDLNGLDTIWMDNENGPGRSLVVYARRGTAEILRESNKIEVSSLTHEKVNDSIVFTATGKNGEGRQEIATGSKSIGGLTGKPFDNAIMTASTRALRRLTMQFTKLGILDESEIEAVHNTAPNPAAGAELAGSPVVIPPAPAVVNNLPGRDITAPQIAVVPNSHTYHHTPDIAEVYAEGKASLAAMPTPTSAKTSAIEQPAAPVTPAPAPVAAVPEAAKEAAPAPPVRRPRARKNTVSMDVEPEVVNTPAPAAPVSYPSSSMAAVAASIPPAPPVAPQPAPAPAAAPVAVPVTGTSVPNQGTDFPGKPTEAQMADYRKRVSVYTNELPSSENMGSVQKMRAFITKMSGTPPQTMTTDQWEEMLSWFESFVERNKVKGLVTYINDSLGVK